MRSNFAKEKAMIIQVIDEPQPDYIEIEHEYMVQNIKPLSNDEVGMFIESIPVQDATMYHMNCEHCWHLWWSKTGFDKQCPKCGKNPHPKKDTTLIKEKY